MRVVKNTVNVLLNVRKEELIKGKYISYELVSNKLKEKEEEEHLIYKALRSKFYNSSFCGKYNISTECGVKCIDVKNPMKGRASLEIAFEVDEE